jgi:multiple sugar transport system permease protein
MRKKSPVVAIAFWTLISFLTPIPIYWLFVISVKLAVELSRKPSVILSDLFRGQLYRGAGDRLTRSYMINSLMISSGNAVLCTALGCFTCCPLSRFNMSGKKSIFLWTITSRMVPSAVFLLPPLLLMTKACAVGDYNLLDTRIGMVFGLLHLQSAFCHLDAAFLR